MKMINKYIHLWDMWDMKMWDTFHFWRARNFFILFLGRLLALLGSVQLDAAIQGWARASWAERRRLAWAVICI